MQSNHGKSGTPEGGSVVSHLGSLCMALRGCYMGLFLSCRKHWVLSLGAEEQGMRWFPRREVEEAGEGVGGPLVTEQLLG